MEAYAADDAKSAAQLLAAGHLHKENDDRFNAVTQALEREADYKPGSVRAGVTQGAKPGFHCADVVAEQPEMLRTFACMCLHV